MCINVNKDLQKKKKKSTLMYSPQMYLRCWELILQLLSTAGSNNMHL